MIIKGKPLSTFLFRLLAWPVGLFLKGRFRKLEIHGVEIKPGHSYLLMANHFSFLDGCWAYYLCRKLFYAKDKMQHMHVMVLKKQMQRNKWLKYIGAFSVDPGKRSISESFEHAAELLSKPGNLLLFYPQGKLESNYIRTIQFEEGLYEIISRVKGSCQLVWCSSFTEYFESTLPSLSMNLLDLGTNAGFDFGRVKQEVNDFHRMAMAKNFRFTVEE